jgi:NhaP-type Na+/H+ or K+/H+ antiporter
VHATPSFTFALALGVGVACQLIARHTRVPSIVFLLGAGVALGPDVLGWIVPESLGGGLPSIVALAVAIILFEGGLNLDMRRLRREATPIRRLVTLGAVVTMAGAATAAYFILGWSLQLSVLFGALVIVTGPTVVRPILRNVSLRPRLATVLEAEGLLIDPVGAIIAAVTLQIVVSPSLDTFASGAVGLMARIGFGTGAGLLFGFVLVGLLRMRRAVPEGLENLVALGAALVAFELCEAWLTDSGILAVTVGGVVVGNMEKRVAAQLGEFQEHLTIGLIGILFVLLAADVRLADVTALGIPGLLTVGALALLVRPVGVGLSTLGSDFSLRERAFLSWVGPRGVVAAAIASLAAAALDDAAVAGGDEIRALVFLTIAVTVVAQGGTAPLVARALGVRGPGRESVVILGAEELAFALAETIRKDDERIVFADSNPNHCHAAEVLGYSVVFGDAFAERTLAHMRLERAHTVVAMTANAQVNGHFAAEAKDDYNVPHAYVAIGRDTQSVGQRIVEKMEGRVLFDRPKDIERWNVRFRHRAAEVRSFVFEGRSEDDSEHDRPVEGTVDPFVVLAIERGGEMVPAFADMAPESGARALAAIHLEAEEAAIAELAALGYRAHEEPDAAVPTDENGENGG